MADEVDTWLMKLSTYDAARDDTDAGEFRDAYEKTRRSYEFGVLTHRLRKAAGLTQKELATHMGTTVSAIDLPAVTFGAA
jgi:DNA-binding transcriptional regulator YiaG